MFDIGFTELITIGVVALIVIGPERLPKVARTAGHLYGRMQRYVSSVKTDISREIELDELKRAGQEFKASLDSTVSDVKQQASVVDDYLRDEAAGLRNGVADLERSIAAPGAEPDMPPLSEPAIPASPRRERSTASAAPQQSLPLDEPDQNAATQTAARAEGSTGEDAGKTA